MKKVFNIIKIFAMLAFIPLSSIDVYAADMSDKYTSSNCDINNPYWGVSYSYDVSNANFGSLSLNANNFPRSISSDSISTNFIYDIIGASISYDTLYISGWAFNTSTDSSGEGARAYENLKFRLVTTDNSQTIDLTDVREGGWYITKQWLCNRNSVDSMTLHWSTASNSFEWYKTAGECKSPNPRTGGMGFGLYIDLTNPSLEEGKKYKLQVQYNGGRKSSGWKNVSVAKDVIGQDIKNYTNRQSDRMEIAITGGTDKVKINSSGTPVGSNGLVCSLWKDQKTVKDAINTHFNGGTYTYTGIKKRITLNSNDGDGIYMYQVGIDNSGKSGNSNKAYAASVWTEFVSDPGPDDGTITIEMKKRQGMTIEAGEQIPLKGCEGKDIYSFNYMFLASVKNDRNGVMSNSAEKNGFADSLILENNFEVSSLNELNIGQKITEITKDNVLDFYRWWNSAAKAPNKYIQEGNNYYLIYDKWCTLDATGNVVECHEDTGDSANETYSPQRLAEATTVLDPTEDGSPALRIAPVRLSTNKGFAFNIERNFIAHPEGRRQLLNPSRVTNPLGDRSIHPAMYTVTFCKNEKMNCEDTTNPAICSKSDDGTQVVFHENNDFKTCTIPKDQPSGFTAIDADETMAPNGKSYCTLSCKEDITIELPGYKETAAGQYFQLDNYVPTVKAKRTCVTASADGTSGVDYDGFQNDLKVYEDRMPKEYNDYQDYKNLHNYFNDGYEKAESIKIDSNKDFYYESWTETCTCTTGNECVVDDPVSYKMEEYVVGNNLYQYAQDVSSKCDDYETGSDPSFQSQFGMTPRAYADSLNERKNLNGGGVGTVTAGVETVVCRKNGINIITTRQYENWTIDPSNLDLNTRSYNFNGTNGSWKGESACDNNATGTKYKERIDALVDDYYGKARVEWDNYNNDLDDYAATINAYNTCFNWNDPTDNASVTRGRFLEQDGESKIDKGTSNSYEYYMYKFKPSVSFDYPDRDGKIFPVAYNYKYPIDYNNSEDVTGSGYGIDGTISDTRVISWNQGATTDNSYSGGDNDKEKNSPADKTTNQVERNILSCSGKTCNATDGINFLFYNSAYIKRIESVNYEYHLPQVYTKIPNGKVEIKITDSNTASWLELPKEAVPVNINTKGGTYPYTITFSDIVNKEDIRAIAKDKDNSSNDNFEERFNSVLSNGEYVCYYDVTNDIYIPGPDSKYNFFYRTVDPYDINPVKRTLGYNWNDERGQEIQRRMAEAEADYQELTSGENKGTFKFTLTSTIMKEIRNYNKRQSEGYSDWDLSCFDYGNGDMGYHCYSPFLSCLASGGSQTGDSTVTSCNNIFGNSLNDYEKYSNGYDYFQLNENRKELIQKQNEIDRTLGHAKANNN